MRALTLTQPRATLVAVGAKTIETRSWQTSYRGPIAIHAGAGLGPVGGVAGLQALCCSEPFQTALRGDGRAHLLDPSFFANNLPRGCIVAVATLTDCLRIGGLFHGEFTPPDPETPEYHFGDYTAGRYAWILRHVVALSDPLPARGALGLWEVDPALVARFTEVTRG